MHRFHSARLLGCLSLAIMATPALATETQTYSYDGHGRLIKVERSGTVSAGVMTSYTHDKAHNRTRKLTTGSPNPPGP